MPTLANRNNNPGNLKDPSTGQFRNFASPQEGYAALLNDLETKKTGGSKTGVKPNHTLADFAKIYAPAVDNNDPAQYTANIANFMGVRPDTPINQLDTGKWAEAIARAEGYENKQPVQQHQGQPLAPIANADTGGQPATPQPEVPNPYGATFRATGSETPGQAALKALGNVPSSTLNLGKGILQAATHPVQTVKGIVKTTLGGLQKGASAIVNNTKVGEVTDKDGVSLKDKLAAIQGSEAEKTFEAVTDALKERYGSVDKAMKSAIEDPVGVGSDIFTILEGGAGIIGKTGQLASAVSKVAKPVTATADALAYVPKKAVSEALGLSTGVGGNAIKEAYQASKQGKTARKAFTDAMRGKTTPDEIVNAARGALGEVVDERRTGYQEMLKNLGDDKTTYDISPIANAVPEQMKKFKITRDSAGNLDFSRSKFALDTAAQNDIQKLVDYVDGYGLQKGDRTALGIDNLKQVLGGYFSQNSDYRAFVQGLKKSADGVLQKVPGYSDAMKNYAELSDTIKDIQQSLSLGDNAMVETTFKKLTNALKNNDFRKQVLESLDADTGGNLIGKIAGQRVSEFTPRGLAALTGGAGSVFAVTHGGILPLLGMVMTTSPRIVGEFVRLLGMGSMKSAQLMKQLDKFAKPGVVTGTISNRVNSRDAQE